MSCGNINKTNKTNTIYTMKQSELKQIIKEETAKVLKEKINFILGPTIHGDPNKPMKDDYYIVFNDTKKAIITIGKVNEDLKARGLKPIEYNNVGFVFKKPSNQQFQFVLNAFNDQDVMNVGRVLK